MKLEITYEVYRYNKWYPTSTEVDLDKIAYDTDLWSIRNLTFKTKTNANN